MPLSTLRSPLCARLGIAHPILLAPMGGGYSTPALVAAVSEAGGLGSLGSGYDAPEKIRESIRAVRALTARPFAVNLFVGEPATADRAALGRAMALLRPYRQELGLADPALPASFGQSFAAQLQVVLEERVPVFSFTFGIPHPAQLAALRSQGAAVLGTATTVAEAHALEEAGVDAILAQGAEAGAHRGSFLAAEGSPLVGTFALVPQVCDAVRVPVVAAGGIMDGRGIVAALALGAQAAALGTAFLRTPECGTSAPHRLSLATARPDATTLTRAFSGKTARGLNNRFMRDLAAAEHELLPYPIHNELTRDIRAAAARAGQRDLLSLWAGQGFPLCRELGARELVATLVAETQAALDRLKA